MVNTVSNPFRRPEMDEADVPMEWLDFGLNLNNLPPNVTIDDIMQPLLQGYPNRPAQPTTPNAHAPDPAVSFFFYQLACLF